MTNSIKNTKTQNNGFTLIETMVAITILVVAISSPLSLAAQSLFVAYYARDQITAFYLAQEGIEMVKNRRDGNMLEYESGEINRNWLYGIPANTNFLVDAPNNTFPFYVCEGVCPALKKNDMFYNHALGDDSRFIRTVRVVPNAENADQATEAIILSKVEWKTGAFNKREFTMKAHIYPWLIK